MTNDDIRAIYKDYPWATEDTLAQIVAASKSAGGRSLRKVNEILKGLDLEPLSNIVDDLTDQEKKLADDLDKLGQAAQKNVRNLTRDTDPIAAMAELMNTAGKAVSGAGSLIGKIPGIGTAVGRVTGGVGAVVQVTAGAAATLGAIATEQEKMTRAMIEYGLAVRDLDEFTDMRGILAKVGMSMGELTQVLEGNKGTFAQISDDTYAGTRDFLQFAAELEKQNVEHGGDFGYGVEELTQRLAEETKILFQINGMTSLDNHARQKIRENFAKSSAMTTFMANATGEQRSAMLKMRAEAAANIDFRQAMVQNANFIAQTLGKEAQENINNAQQQMSMMMGVLVPSMKEETDALFTEAVRDLHLDQTAINNAKGPLLDRLALLGADVQQEYFRIMDASITGKLSGTDLVIALQGLAKKIQKAQVRQSGQDQTLQEVNRTIAESRMIPRSFTDLTAEQIRAGEEASLFKTEAADDAIDAIDGARKAFRNSLHIITPGYDTMAGGFDVFVSTVDGFGDVMSLFGVGYKNPRLEAEEKFKEATATQEKIVTARKRLSDTLKQANASSGLVRKYYERSAKSQQEDLAKLEGTFDTQLDQAASIDTSRVAAGPTGPVERIYPSAGSDWTAVTASLAQQGITDETEIANIFAQMQAESGGDAAKRESMAYSASRLLEVFPKKFRSIADAQAVVAGGPEAIGNRIYGGRMGNAANEGYKYRGRGLVQLTGKNNYEKYGKILGIDLVNNPELAADPEISRKLGALYFKTAKDKGANLRDINQIGQAVGYVDHAGAETRKRAGIARGFMEMLAKGATAGSTTSASAVPNNAKNTKDIAELRKKELRLAELRATARHKSLSSRQRSHVEQEIQQLEQILGQINRTFESENLHAHGA